MSVKVETTDGTEHVHKADPLYGQQEMNVGGKVWYRWTPKMNEIILQCVSNKGKPVVALRNMRDAGCFDHIQPEPSMEQLYNKIRETKKSLNPEPKVTTTFDMRQLINKHLEVPDDEMEAFIPFYDIQDEKPSNPRFTVIFASKRSLARWILL